MAITWTSGPKAGMVEFAGRVLEIGVRTVRVMSDVWEDERYATVWTGEELDYPALSDWAYVMPDGSMSKGYKEGAQHQHFFPSQVEADATEETLAAVAEWRRVNQIIRDTDTLYKQAQQLRHGRRVEVHAGRKVPHGDCYEIDQEPTVGQYGTYVNLRHAREDKRYYYVSVDNVRVVNPEQYIGGPVACSCCRKVWATWAESPLANRQRRDYPRITCRECHWKAILNGDASLPRPKDAKLTDYYGSFLTPKEHRQPIEEKFAREIFDSNGDSMPWLIYADWLDENLPDGEEANKRAEAIRLMAGFIKPKKVSYRKKDLKVSPLEKAEYNGWYCWIEGFPPFKVGAAGPEIVKLRAYTLGHSWRGLACFTADGKTEYYWTNQIPSVLKRLVKQVLPSAEVITV